jgi:dihydrofolate synthase/folylpolyglutamate synthase
LAPEVPGVPSAPLSYREARAAVEGRGQGIRPGLARVEALTELLDHPERTYPTVQLAGTNGKSTTARMTGAILAAHGLRSGIYTSPHLQSIRERFLLGGDDEGRVAVGLIDPDEFAALVQYLLPFVGLVESRLGERVTYFELTTAMAFEWMADRSVAAGVYEAGLGGAWDATNVVRGDVSVLTRIGVDHIDLLGATPLDNAREKVGIVKPGARCVSATQQDDVADLVTRTARELGATLAVQGVDFRLAADAPAIGGRLISVDGPSGHRYEDLFVPLFGAPMAANATLAIAACEELLGRELNQEALAAGLGAVESPGRMEVVGREPVILLDGAHNPQAAAVLGPALAETFGGVPKVFVVSVFADKDVEGVLAGFAPFASRMVFWQASSPRSAPVEALEAAAGRAGILAGTTGTAGSLAEAIEMAKALAGAEGMLVVTGSLFAVGEARSLLVGPVP